MKPTKLVALLPLVFCISGCRVYDASPKGIAAVTYAQIAKQRVVEMKKDKPNDTVNTWIKTLADSTEATAQQRFSKVDLGVSTIPKGVRDEVVKTLGKDIPIEAAIASEANPANPVIAASGMTKAVALDDENIAVGVAIGKAIIDWLDKFNFTDRKKQAEYIIKKLNDSKWGPPAAK